MGHIFISYAEEDSASALQIALGLEEAGFTTWHYQRDSKPGTAHSYLDQIDAAIESCTAFLVVISAHSTRSHQVKSEVIRAHEGGKPFIPILLDMTHHEFQTRNPGWRMAVGGAVSLSVGPGKVKTILPQIVAGLSRAAAESSPPAEALRPQRSTLVNDKAPRVGDQDNVRILPAKTESIEGPTVRPPVSKKSHAGSSTNISLPAGQLPRHPSHPSAWSRSLAWMGTGCGGIIILGLISLIVVGFLVKKKVDHSSAMAAAELAVRANPDLELVSSDSKAGSITVKGKKSGEVMTFKAEDVVNGKISFTTKDGTKIDALGAKNGGGATYKLIDEKGQEQVATFGGFTIPLPSWVPAYPGGNVQGIFDTTDPGGRSAAFGVSTTDATGKVLDWYEAQMKAAGLKVEKSTDKANGEIEGIVKAKSDDERRTVSISVSSKAGMAQATVTFEDKKYPSWVPQYPGAAVQETFDTTGPQGRSAAFAVSTTDATRKVLAWYETQLKAAGLRVEKSTYKANGQTGGTVTAKSNDEKRTVNIMVGFAEGKTQATVTFEDKK